MIELSKMIIIIQHVIIDAHIRYLASKVYNQCKTQPEKGVMHYFIVFRTDKKLPEINTSQVYCEYTTQYVRE